jgi:acyl carrier protein
MNMTHADIIERTTAYIRDNFLYMRPDVAVQSDARLLERGIIDSLGVMELVSFIESTFGVTVEDENITEDNLGSIDAVAAFVMTRTATSSAA